MDIVVFILISFILGLLIGLQITKSRYKLKVQLEKESAVSSYNALDKEFTQYKSSTDEKLKTANYAIDDQKMRNEALNQTIIKKNDQLEQLTTDLATVRANLSAENNMLEQKIKDYSDVKKELSDQTIELISVNNKLATLDALNKTLNSSIENDKIEVAKLRAQFTLEFENIANKILENKTEKYTQ